MLKKWILAAAIAVTLTSHAQEKPYNPAFSPYLNWPSFDAQLDRRTCDTIFPYNIRIKRPLESPWSNTSFSLFAFTTNAFNPSLPSLLMLDGGPGQLWGIGGAHYLTSLYPGHNIVFFHNRGGGCSSFKNSETKMDHFISAMSTAQDIEEIRKAYGINQWKAVFGYSYGTTAARVYVNRFPKATKSLVLEGLGQLRTEAASNQKRGEDNNKTDKANLIKTIESRRSLTSSSVARISTPDYEEMMKGIDTYLNEVPVVWLWNLSISWDAYSQQLRAYNESIGVPIPAYFNEETTNAFVLLMYSGGSEESDYYIHLLAHNFSNSKVAPDVYKELTDFTKQSISSMIPYKNLNYASDFNSMAMSYRIYLSTLENNAHLETKDICVTVPTLIISGSLDGATPPRVADEYLTSSECTKTNPKYANRSIVIEGGGHISSTQVRCVNLHAINFINGVKNQYVQTPCSMPITIKDY